MTTRKKLYKRIQTAIIRFLLCYAVCVTVWVTIYTYQTEPFPRIDFQLPRIHVQSFEERTALENQATVTPVVIVTYMRSGSSLIGDILQQDPDAFYVYEPLQQLETAYFKRTDPNTKIRQPRLTPDYYRKALKVMEAWIYCNVTYILADKERRLMFYKYGKKTRGFKTCLNSTETVGGAKERLEKCVAKLQNQCLASRFRVIKTIRMSLKWVMKLLDVFPQMKVIYLVRDPRATLTSQMKYGMCAALYGGIAGCSKALCSNIAEDMVVYRRLLKNNYQGVKVLQYEDLAKRPLLVTEQLYDFVGAKYTATVAEYVYNITLAGKTGPASLNIKPNSSAIINEWRMYLDETNLQQFQVSLSSTPSLLGGRPPRSSLGITPLCRHN